MAYFRLLTLEIFCIIVCWTGLGLATPVEDGESNVPLDQALDKVNTPAVNASNEEATTEVLPTLNNTNLETTNTTTSAATSSAPTTTNISVLGNNSSTNATATPTTSGGSVIDGELEEPDPETHNKTTGNENDVIEAPKEFRFWWSDSTTMSILIPVCLGLGSGLFIITWMCCMRWICCRRRPCCGGRKHFRGSPSTNKKTLRVKEDFRQLRQVDRMKLLAESSDEEF